MEEIEVNSKAPRAQGGLGLLSQTILVQRSQKYIPLVLIHEREEEKKGRNREAPGDGVVA
jgi:hypothetical protein